MDRGYCSCSTAGGHAYGPLAPFTKESTIAAFFPRGQLILSHVDVFGQAMMDGEEDQFQAV
jgi:hypothetical protein